MIQKYFECGCCQETIVFNLIWAIDISIFGGSGPFTND